MSFNFTLSKMPFTTCVYLDPFTQWRTRHAMASVLLVVLLVVLLLRCIQLVWEKNHCNMAVPLSTQHPFSCRLSASHQIERRSANECHVPVNYQFLFCWHTTDLPGQPHVARFFVYAVATRPYAARRSLAMLPMQSEQPCVWTVGIWWWNVQCYEKPQLFESMYESPMYYGSPLLHRALVYAVLKATSGIDMSRVMDLQSSAVWDNCKWPRHITQTTCGTFSFVRCSVSCCQVLRCASLFIG